MNADLEAKIGKLREIYPSLEDQCLIDDIESDLRRRIEQRKFSEDSLVQDIVKDAARKIAAINQRLTSDRELPEPERKLLFDLRDLHQFYLDRFDPSAAERAIASTESYVDNKLLVG